MECGVGRESVGSCRRGRPSVCHHTIPEALQRCAVPRNRRWNQGLLRGLERSGAMIAETTEALRWFYRQALRHR